MPLRVAGPFLPAVQLQSLEEINPEPRAPTSGQSSRSAATPTEEGVISLEQ